MNYIVLEGFWLYLFLILTLGLVMISFLCVVYAAFADKRNFLMRESLKKLTVKNRLLTKANMRLKLKCGELDTDD